MKPNSVELLQGVQGALMTYILPEVQSDYARTELMLVNVLLGIAANDVDGAAQGLVDDNAALRSLAGEAASVLESAQLAEAGGLAGDLAELASSGDASVRLSDLSAANDRLRDAIGRLGAALVDSDAQEHITLRAKVVERLRAELAAKPHDLMGARSDG